MFFFISSAFEIIGSFWLHITYDGNRNYEPSKFTGETVDCSQHQAMDAEDARSYYCDGDIDTADQCFGIECPVIASDNDDVHEKLLNDQSEIDSSSHENAAERPFMMYTKWAGMFRWAGYSEWPQDSDLSLYPQSYNTGACYISTTASAMEPASGVEPMDDGAVAEASGVAPMDNGEVVETSAIAVDKGVAEVCDTEAIDDSVYSPIIGLEPLEDVTFETTTDGSQQQDTAPVVFRLSISKDFLQRIDVDGTRSLSYGWYERPFGHDTSNDPNDFKHIKLEDFLYEANVHKCREHGDSGSIFEKLPRLLPKNCKKIVHVAVYLGKLTFEHDENWEGSLFLYCDIDDTQRRIAVALGLLQEDIVKSRKQNGALRKRLNKLERQLGRIYRPPVLLKVYRDVFFKFEAVDSSLQPPRECQNHKHLFIPFRLDYKVDFNQIFDKFQAIFNNTTSDTTVEAAHPKTTRTVVSLDGDVALQLVNTVNAMDIPDCPETYQVRSSKQNDRGIKRIRETSWSNELSSSDEEEDDDSQSLFPRDPEAELCKRQDICDAFSKVLSITELATAIKNFRASLVTHFPEDTDKQLFIEGMVSSIFYSNLRWRLSESESIARSMVNELQRTTFDIDQVSLDVAFKAQSYNFSHNFASNTQFLSFMFDHLSQQVRYTFEFALNS